MKAFLLAAGKGKRLLPLTKETPKPLVKVGGISLIERNLYNLKKGNVLEVIINIHHLGEKIINLLGDGSKYGLKISYSIEGQLLGTGGGMPGLIVAIAMKKIKNEMKVSLYEKSYHKCNFLKEVSKKLNLNTEVIQKDIFTVKNIETGTIMSRAFKPMPVILNLVNENFNRFKNIIFQNNIPMEQANGHHLMLLHI